jgi:hypothetical protein
MLPINCPDLERHDDSQWRAHASVRYGIDVGAETFDCAQMSDMVLGLCFD